MRSWKFLIPTFLAVLVAPLFGLATPAQANVDVYVTPGTHTVNGRQWKTTCEPYSQTKRCRTEIIATTVSQVNGKFVQSTGWVFNNLTYAASPRTLWKGNPLGGGGVIGGSESWVASDGRQWRTECDTAVTGNGGCRSYIQARIIEPYTSSTGVKGFQWVTKEIFNNMVRFTPGPGVPPSYSTPKATAMPAFLNGRRFLTLGNLVTQTNSGSQARGVARLSNVELNPGGAVGTFKESYWAYTFDMAIESDYGQFRTSIPNRPTGCLSSSKESSDRALLGLPALPSGTCDVRTARSFLGSPTVRYGTYEVLSGNRIKFHWRGTSVTETYLNVTGANQAYNELRMMAHTHPNAVDAMGFAFASKKAPSAGRSFIPEISKSPWQPPASVNPSVASQSQFPTSAGGADKTFWTQTVGNPNMAAHRQSFQFSHYVNGGANCVVTPESVRGRVEHGWHSWMCPLGSDGKFVWNHMVSSLVAEAHVLCPVYVPGSDANAHWKRCQAASPKTVKYSLPARPGGHVLEGLQLIDDNNQLAAIVGVESSLYSHKASSQSQLALFAAIAPR